MKKIFFFTLLLFAAGYLSAQTSNVGIGTNNPASKLSVNGNTAIGSGYIGNSAPANGAIIQGRVGVGTTAPQAKLHVNGNMILDSVNYYSGNNASTLVRDNASGEVKVVATASGNTKPLSYVRFSLTNCAGDWIRDFDTKIPVATYTLAIVGESLKMQNSVLNRLSSPSGTRPYFAYNSNNVFAFQKNGTWHISADYAGGTPVGDNGGAAPQGDWQINCLVVNNSLIKVSATASDDLFGSDTGSATAPPTGF